MSIYINIEKSLQSFKLKVELEGGDEVISLLGGSGCGKSMTLKCIAGIEKPDYGSIVVDGVMLFDSKKGINLSPQKRYTGLLFQNYALFPNMTVLENIKAGARREKDIKKRDLLVNDIIESFGLKDLLSRPPSRLSGGQQQRVALARILVSSPKILLLDEPFSALDSHLRFRLENEVREILEKFGKTVLFVSHDRDEVYRLSSKIAIMESGEIQSFGAKNEVFKNPKTRCGAILTGCKNISPIKAIANRRVFATDWGVELDLNEDVSDYKYIGIRVHDLSINKGENSHNFKVLYTIENPFSYTVMVRALEDSIPIGIEINKEAFRDFNLDYISLAFPKDKLLLLKD